VIPLKDENPSRTFPLVTLLLIGANVIVFAYEETLPPSQLQSLVASLGAVPRAFAGGAFRIESVPALPWWTLISSMFVHGGILHLAGNMLFLWIFGDNVEDALGHARYLVFYFLCGVSAGLVQILANPASRIPLVGASGAIAGVLGAYALLYPTARVQTLVFLFIFIRIIPLPAILLLGLWFLLQVVAAPSGSGAGVAFFAHIGGFLAGMVLVGLMANRRRRA